MKMNCEECNYRDTQHCLWKDCPYKEDVEQETFTHPSYNGAVFDRTTGALIDKGDN